MAAASSDEDSDNHRLPRVAAADKPDSRWVYMFLNGDEHFEPLKTLVNQRHYRSLESLLEKLTERIRPSFGAIRSLYTPRHGHRVSSIDDLRGNERYVAAGYEKFRQLPHGRTYETLAQNASGKASQSEIAEAHEEDDNYEVGTKSHSQEMAAVAMKEASTSTTEDKETATTMSLYSNHEVEDSAIQTNSVEAVRAGDINLDQIPDQNMTSENVNEPASYAEPPPDMANNENDSVENRSNSGRSPEPNMPLKHSGSNSAAQLSREDVPTDDMKDISPPTKEADDDDPSEIAYTTPPQDAKHLQDLEQHLHTMSENGNHKLKTSPDRASKPEESDNISLASLNSFYEHEQQILRAETEASKSSAKRSGSRQSARQESIDALKQQWELSENVIEKSASKDLGDDKLGSSEERDAAFEPLGALPQSEAPPGTQLSDAKAHVNGERPRPAARRKSSGSINATSSGLGKEPQVAPNDSPLTQRSMRVNETRASVNTTSSGVRKDLLNDNTSRRERRSSVHSIGSQGQNPSVESSSRAASLTKQPSLDESKSRHSEKRASKPSRAPSQDRTPASVTEKSAMKNPSGSISHSSRKTNEDGRRATQSKTPKNGMEKRVPGAKSKRPPEEDNRGWSRSSSVESLKSNKDSGYSPASERSKDSSEAPHRLKDTRDVSRTQGAASSSKLSQEKLGSIYYAPSPPHSPIRTYAYLVQEKPAVASYDYRSSEGGPASQALYSSAPLRYSSATKNQWKPDTYPILEEDDVFYAKSSRGKKLDAYREIDLDEDSGGVFRARQLITDTGEAVEIQEGMDTKVDIPIDDMEALEVEEEYLPPEHTRIARSASGGPGHRIVTFLPSAGTHDHLTQRGIGRG
ncbi:hypothetical protein V5799_008223 [Amblyomma americanum]|uniref:Doublecortin domain-containing protein n=1 Tax=Amblyomma americanum TaxID=6943 RepID=A0AAQ4FDZ9_AMBAM